MVQQVAPTQWCVVRGEHSVSSRRVEGLPHGHPDTRFVEYLLRGIFKLALTTRGWSASQYKISRGKPHHSGRIPGQRGGLGRVVGPVNGHQGVKVQVNTFGAMPKSHQPGKWG